MTPAEFAARCWARAAEGMADEEARERLEGAGLACEIYTACDLVRLSFTRKDGGRMALSLPALEVIEREFGLTREVRSEPDAAGDFNLILNRSGRYVARLTSEKLFVEPKACDLALGCDLLNSAVTS